MWGMSLLLAQSFFGLLSINQPGYGKSWMSWTLGNSKCWNPMNQDMSLNAAPWREVSGIHLQIRKLPPHAINPSRHVTVIGKNIFNSSFYPIRSENVRRCTLMICCTTLMDTWSDTLLLILPAARTGVVTGVTTTPFAVCSSSSSSSLESTETLSSSP